MFTGVINKEKFLRAKNDGAPSITGVSIDVAHTKNLY